MSLILGNPYGWWMLLGVPAVLSIHLLQQRRKKVEVSTLFLLDVMPLESVQGRVVDRIRSSLPLYLQLLAVLLLTWLFLEPRWLRPESMQRIVLVLDSSLSMAPFKSKLGTELIPSLTSLSQAAARTEWVLLESDGQTGVLYTGGSLAEVERVLNTWHPSRGLHDVEPALKMAQTLLGAVGMLVFISDHKQELPAGVVLYSIGEPIENVGFTGVRIVKRDGETIWHALVKNYAKTTQVREWWLDVAGQSSSSQTLSLEPGQVRTLEGVMPPGEQDYTLSVSADRFSLDDRLPLVYPLAKQLKARIAVDAPQPEFFERLFAALERIKLVDPLRTTDMYVSTMTPQGFLKPDRSGIFFAREGTSKTKSKGVAPGKVVRKRGRMIAERHHLMQGLKWQGLRLRGSHPLQLNDKDKVLLWQGKKPVISIRTESGSRQLIFNFQLNKSNARSLPSFVILLQRFIEQLRASKTGYFQSNVELDQSLGLSADVTAGFVDIETRYSNDGAIEKSSLAPHQLRFIRAPLRPGKLRVQQLDRALFQGAAHFSDPREAELSKLMSYDGISAEKSKLALGNSEEDFLFPLWVLLLAGLLLAVWYVLGQERGSRSLFSALPSTLHKRQ